MSRNGLLEITDHALEELVAYKASGAGGEGFELQDAISALRELSAALTAAEEPAGENTSPSLSSP